jgi:glucosyl-dolichyl phosphate glucuronosyltransferase
MTDVSRRLTVAIPTHNRSTVLRHTLEQLTRMLVPDGFDWELIVVQNNCSDDTASLLAEYQHRLPLRALSEVRPGVNHARNAAVEAARGEIIVFTDDDTLPVEGWLAAYVSAFDAWPEASVFGGPIVPHFTSEPPQWLRDALPLLATAYGSIEARGRGAQLSQTFFPFGANMAFRTACLRARAFDPSLGPRGKTRINGSERELILHLLANGNSGRWVEDARVRHCIQPKQMTVEFLRWYWTGEGAAMALAPIDPGTKMMWGRPRWLWREAIAAELRFRAHRLRGVDANIWVKDLKRASTTRGLLTGRGRTFA